MKKHGIIKLFIIALCALLLSSCGRNPNFRMATLSPDKPDTALNSLTNPDSEVRGVWIATVFNIDFPSYYDLDEDKLKSEIDSIIATCKAHELNTIFFQVRPSCDALYKSELFPVSKVLSTTGELQFDVLEYFVTEAHKNGIFLHAWVNPLRITVSANAEDKLPEDSPAKLHPEWVVKYADGKLYFDAGLPEVREFIAEGVREIVKNYNVDGVVFDDYFYPYPVSGADFDDADTYEKYGGDFDSVGDFRRDSINKLIKLSYDTVKGIDEDCLFGVAPGGIWQNSTGKNGGSATTGFETYHSLYCDSLAWVEGGYIDYISPQIYWRFDTASAPYGTLAEWWNAKVDGSGVELWISHAAYRYEEGDWVDPAGEMVDQVMYGRELLSYKGSLFYGYDEIRGNDFGLAGELDGLYKNEIIYPDTASTGMDVLITSHYSGMSLKAGKVTVEGMSDPGRELLVGGEHVSRAKSGKFSVELTITEGENEIIFTQGEDEYKLILNGTK